MGQESKDCILESVLDRIPQEMRIMFGTLLLFRVIESRMGQLHVELPLSKPARHLLLHLGTPRRMGQLAEDLNTQPSAVTAAADDLEKRGLILRERVPEDRRAWQLRLTEAGEATRRRLIETTVRVFHEITDMTEPEIEQLATLMDKVTKHLLKNGIPNGLTL